MNFTENIILENDVVLLRPLAEKNRTALSKIAFHAEIWKHSVTSGENEELLEEWINVALSSREKAERYPFVILDKASGRISGSTSIGSISRTDKRAEIGWTWLGLEFQGTGINRHSKYLLLKYLFENLLFERIEFKTDYLNAKSRSALKKIGATEEGVLRSHTLMHDGRRRDTIYYSILKNEWEKIKETIFSDIL